MNQIERHVEMAHKHLKQIKFTFTFISLSILLGISSLALLADIAHAQEDETGTSSVSQEERSTMLETRRASATAAQEERIEERRAALAEKAQERITNLAANMSNRMEAAIARLQQISGRIDSRIMKLDGEGINTDEAAAHVSEANASLGEAATLIAGIDELILDVTTSENPREVWTQVKETYRGIHETIRSAHASLRAAVATLKVAVAESDSSTGVSDVVRNPNSYAEETDETPDDDTPTENVTE